MLSVVLTDAPGWMGPALAGALRRHAAVGRVLDGERALAVGEPDVDVLVHAVSSDGDTGGEAASLSRLRRALRAASGSGVSAVVLVSHATTYGAWSTSPVPLSEEAPLRPRPGFAHGVSRAEAERLVGEWRAADGHRRAAILRTACVVDRPLGDPLSRALLALLRVPGREGGPPVQFVHAHDVLAAVVTAATEPLEGPFNVAPDGWLADEQLRGLLGGPARLTLPSRISRPLGLLAGRLRSGPSLPGLGPYAQHPWVVANDRLRATGWRPLYSNEEALVVALQ
ncbi:MAG TPA: NAD-dependent epimerase/dehydratase family protein [Acidimicrobiales bacterium]|nr:NAD-dependent epimerase/dehydratase family protein [Acidimicrobiales bacterium]